MQSQSALSALESWFSECPGALVAFSGGVDSSLVAFLAHHFLGTSQNLALVSASPSLKLSDLEEAKSFARRHNIPLRIIVTDEMNDPNYASNPNNRCYFCKHNLYHHLSQWQNEYPGWWILNGTNADDSQDYRPGLTAASEFAVRSPLAECHMDKAAVRALAAHFSLSCWDKPASPCLASRVPYGDDITVAKLKQIEEGEALLSQRGFRQSRVRHYQSYARIEVLPRDLPALQKQYDSLSQSFQAIGFPRIEIDSEGLVSGKLNRALMQ